LVASAGFKNSYIFKYSPRPGTKAYELYPDDVPEEVKRRRNNDLLAIQAEVSLADHRRFVGQVVEILVEGPSKWAYKLRHQIPDSPNGGSDPLPGAGEILQLTGRTDTDHIVVFDGPTELIGEFVLVYIEDASPYTLFGRLVARSDGSQARQVRLDPDALTALGSENGCCAASGLPAGTETLQRLEAHPERAADAPGASRLSSRRLSLPLV
jgi:hypothetical protein